MDSPLRRRIGWRGLVVLLAVLAVALVVVLVVNERADLENEDGPFVGAIEPAESEEEGWRRHDWGGGAAATPIPTGPRPADPTGRDAVYDPQRTAMRESFGEDGGRPPFRPTIRAATIAAHEGALPAAPEAACEVRVLPVAREAFDCVVRVLCAGAVLYPNESQTAGYLDCDVAEGAVRGAEDPDDAAIDGDPRLELDLSAGTVEVVGEGWRAALRLSP